MIAGILVLVGAVVMYFVLQWAMPLPLQASTQAGEIDWLFQAHMVLIAFLFSLVVVLMVYSLVVFRRRGDDEGDGDHFEGNTPLEIAWTVIPLVVVIVFAYLGVQSLRAISAKQENELTVNIEGAQWAFSFSYPDTGVKSADLVLPVNQPALMHMTARDVIHSFWVPEFRVKKDLVPGQVTELRITPTIEGDYHLSCAEMCGLSHYNMVSNVRVVSEAEFTAWMNEQIVEQGLEVAEKSAATN